jgi:hypothetical protein
MTKILVTFRKFANAPKMVRYNVTIVRTSFPRYYINKCELIFNMVITRLLFFWDVTLHHWVPDVMRQCSGLIFKGQSIQEEQISNRTVQCTLNSAAMEMMLQCFRQHSKE